jgi:hypothetical protein
MKKEEILDTKSLKLILSNSLLRTLEKTILEIGLNIGILISEDESTISVDVSSNLKNLKDDIVLVNHMARTIFKIRGLPETKDSEEGFFNLPDGFIVQLYSIAYSHARALLAVELSPTVYKDKFILPIVDPTKFLKK